MKENVHFLHQEAWQNYDPEGKILKYKLPVILKNIPEDVSSIIDIGCGNGIITNQLGEKYTLTGADFSAEALKNLEGPVLECSSDNVPVEDASFDMVFSSQLLEHLNDEVLEGSCREFKRIARKYILLTVPNEEILAMNDSKCPHCAHVFNVNGHKHSFSVESLAARFEDSFRLRHAEKAGTLRRDYNPFLMRIRQNLGNRYYQPVAYTVCPSCGNSEFPKVKGNLVSKFTNGLNALVGKKKPYWMLLLLERK